MNGTIIIKICLVPEPDMMNEANAIGWNLTMAQIKQIIQEVSSTVLEDTSDSRGPFN